MERNLIRNEMRYYTATIPPTLAEKLKEKGCEHPYAIPEQWEYGFVFDWLMEKGIMITIRAVYFLNGELSGWQPHYNHWGLKKCDSWHEAANAAIEKALTLIKYDDSKRR